MSECIRLEEAETTRDCIERGCRSWPTCQHCYCSSPHLWVSMCVCSMRVRVYLCICVYTVCACVCMCVCACVCVRASWPMCQHCFIDSPLTCVCICVCTVNKLPTLFLLLPSPAGVYVCMQSESACLFLCTRMYCACACMHVCVSVCERERASWPTCQHCY